MGAEDYFLILWDLFRFCREKHIATSPARGSGAGSLVLYLIEVTMIDPLDKDFDLMFERFLNPGRSSQYDFEFKEFPVSQWKESVAAEIIEQNRGKLRDLIRDIMRDDESKRTHLPNITREILPIENQGLDSYYVSMHRDGMEFDHNKPNSWIANLIGLTDVEPDGLMKVTKMGSLPDVDSDFDTARREEVFAYIKEKYGEDHVCHIGTYGTFRGKSTLIDALKMGGLTPTEAFECSKAVPSKCETIAEALNDKTFMGKMQKFGITQETLDKVIKVEGSAFSQVSAHASGIVVAPHSLMDKVPMHHTKEEVVTQWDLSDMETVGYIKFDFLGLSNAGKISACLDLIEKRHGIRIDLRTVSRNDSETLKQFRMRRLDFEWWKWNFTVTF